MKFQTLTQIALLILMMKLNSVLIQTVILNLKKTTISSKNLTMKLLKLMMIQIKKKRRKKLSNQDNLNLMRIMSKSKKLKKMMKKKMPTNTKKKVMITKKKFNQISSIKMDMPPTLMPQMTGKSPKTTQKTKTIFS